MSNEEEEEINEKLYGLSYQVNYLIKDLDKTISEAVACDINMSNQPEARVLGCLEAKLFMANLTIQQIKEASSKLIEMTKKLL